MKLSRAQSELMNDIAEHGVMYVRRHGTWYKTAKVLIRLGLIEESERDYASPGYSFTEAGRAFQEDADAAR